ncbi:MAG TPA: HAD-IIIA family hydrolase [Kineosporiaceae bacterium]|nr:HAD-IIIA family hydrolase [Kineosporiaceae bacterium]
MTRSEVAIGQYAVVIPSLGRPSLQRLLATLTWPPGPPRPAEVVIVDDRPDDRTGTGPGELPSLGTGDSVSGGQPGQLGQPWQPRVIRGFGRGPAAARNAGWQATRSEWVVFLDDDVELPPDWGHLLAVDLAACGPQVGGSQARLEVPLPVDRRPTDWERGTAGLQDAAWATADMAYRRSALEAVAGFDERFPRAYREDADLALRVRQAGWQLVRGERRTLHPVRPVDDWVSLRVQRGNADDALMRRLHGPRWRQEAQVPRGRLRWHGVTTAAALTAAVAGAGGFRWTAAAAGLTWAALTTDFARRRLQPGPGPGTPGWSAEVRRMLLTSVAIPPAAVWHRLRGQLSLRGPVPGWPLPIRAVLFDRDGTLVHDVPYNGDPDLVRPMPGAARAVAAVRAAGLRIAVVTNQSGIARGLLTRAQVEAVNAEVDRQLGGFDSWQICPHGTDEGCACRKPRPGMIQAAARALGVQPRECVVIGDIGADVEAARAAGARAVLVPTDRTRAAEIAAAPIVADTLEQAVELVLGGDGSTAVGLAAVR